MYLIHAEKIPESFKNMRLEMELSQRQFAERFKVSQQTVSAIETGKMTPSIGLLFKVCNGAGSNILLRANEVKND